MGLTQLVGDACEAQGADPQQPRAIQPGTEGEAPGDLAGVGRAEVRGEALQQVLARRGGAARALHQLPKHEEQLRRVDYAPDGEGIGRRRQEVQRKEHLVGAVQARDVLHRQHIPGEEGGVRQLPASKLHHGSGASGESGELLEVQETDPQEPRGMQVGSEGEEEGDLPGIGRAEVRGDAPQQTLPRRGGAVRALRQLPKHEAQLQGVDRLPHAEGERPRHQEVQRG
eukprot:CAMPEP_0181525290 /NCGR_PEP_ID=MMETSP1110-20121109/68891_1 /TAXON_ID=174948 /ORGANISM="Symbiodinium sp., Strain CCMP421" /LENGTH=226 /DNA_ID=CAMNT_0023656089 /DNA_START=1084 /DNA_END=1760 /DNA_ORIENTATION=+